MPRCGCVYRLYVCVLSVVAELTGGGQRGQMPLSATGKGRKTPSQKYFVTSEQKVTMIKHDDWAKLLLFLSPTSVYISSAPILLHSSFLSSPMRPVPRHHCFCGCPRAPRALVTPVLSVYPELSICVTRSNPTHQLIDPTLPTTGGKIWTQPNTTNNRNYGRRCLTPLSPRHYDLTVIG